jgi:hypothetical protein
MSTEIREDTNPPNIFYLDRVTSIHKQLQVHDILMHFNPTHEERLWLVGFLKYAGYTQEEVFKIIDQHCQWQDYNPKITAYQVGTVFNHRVPESRSSSHHKRRKRKWDLSPVEVRRINLARTSEMDRRIGEHLKNIGAPIYESPHSKSLPFKPETLLRRGL